MSNPTDNIRTKPKLNEVARIVNSRFLQSPYDGKDWESVRNDLNTELTALHHQELQRLVSEIEENIVIGTEHCNNLSTAWCEYCLKLAYDQTKQSIKAIKEKWGLK